MTPGKLYCPRRASEEMAAHLVRGVGLGVVALTGAAAALCVVAVLLMVALG